MGIASPELVEASGISRRNRISAQAMIDGEAVAPYILTQARVNSVSIGSNGQGLALNLELLDAPLPSGVERPPNTERTNP